MALIVLHNNDSQGSRAVWAFGGTAHAILRIRFVGDRISPASVHAVRQIAAQYPGPNTIIWLGHGNEGRRAPGTQGHPLTDSEPPRRIRSQDLIGVFCLLNPNRIYLFTCMAMQWVQREARTFYNEMTFLNAEVEIFAATTRIPGAALKHTATSLAGGITNPVGAHGSGHLFETTRIYSETFIQWRQRVSPQTSLLGFNESPI